MTLLVNINQPPSSVTLVILQWAHEQSGYGGENRGYDGSKPRTCTHQGQSDYSHCNS